MNSVPLKLKESHVEVYKLPAPPMERSHDYRYQSFFGQNGDSNLRSTRQELHAEVRKIVAFVTSQDFQACKSSHHVQMGLICGGLRLHDRLMRLSTLNANLELLLSKCMIILTSVTRFVYILMYLVTCQMLCLLPA